MDCKIRMKEVVDIPRGKKPNMLAFGAILLLIVLLSGMALVPAIYVGATVQQQQATTTTNTTAAKSDRC